MISFNSSLFSFRFGNGTNQYTKTTPLSYFRNLFSDIKESYVTVNDNEFELYRTTSQLQTVINKDASLLSNGLFQIKNLKGEVQDTPFTKEVLGLLDNPNPFQGGNAWLVDYMIQKNLYGNQFMYFNRAFSKAFPSTIINLPSARTRIVRSGKLYDQTKIEDIITRYEVLERNGVYIPYDTKDILHSQIINPDDPLMGLSPLHGLTMALSNLRGAYGFRNRIITKNGALGILSSSSKDASGGGIPLDAKERKRIEDQYIQDYGQGDEQSPIMMTNAPLNWQSMSHPTKDLMLFEEVNEDFKTIIDQYGHNENIYSTANSSKYANMNEALRQVYQDRTIPEADNLCFNLSKKLGLVEKGLYLELSYEHLALMKTDEKVKAETQKLKADTIATMMANGYTRQELEDIITF